MIWIDGGAPSCDQGAKVETMFHAHTSFRQYAKEHVERAKILLDGDGHELIYACLELRLAIEALAYDVLQNYAEGVDQSIDAAYAQWQPSKVLEHLRSYDELADVSVRFELTMFDETGHPRIGSPSVVGLDERFTAEWASKAHRSMGSFLHQRTVSQVKKGRKIDKVVLRREASRVMDRLEPIVNSATYGSRQDFRFGFTCENCGGELIVPGASILLQARTRAHCSTCGAAWEVGPTDEVGFPSFTRLR